jgi:hypothetical protein
MSLLNRANDAVLAGNLSSPRLSSIRDARLTCNLLFSIHANKHSRIIEANLEIYHASQNLYEYFFLCLETRGLDC